MKLLIVEDEAKTADYLRDGLAEQGWAVDVARDGTTGLHLARELDYDVIVLDVMLPGMDGFAVLRELRLRKQTPVIMLTARDRIDDRVHGLGAGADDYLVKPFSFIELLARLQALVRRGRQQEPTELQIGDLQINLLARRAFRDATRLDLTGKEFALLALLAQRRGQILSKTVIAAQVWDINFDSHTNVVEVDGPFRNKLLHTVRGMGYVLKAREGDEDDEAPVAGRTSA
ncbi:MAG: heavy metal response regulator transcription factor [Lysobacter sp.]|nr:heavy metal response regulator transcription factor [Lysobacter sp.]